VWHAWGKRRACRVLFGAGGGWDLKERDRLEGQGVDGRIIVNWVVNE
jgi:hypothetical protein